VNKNSIRRNIARSTGFLNWNWKHIPSGLFVFNFHRIGDPNGTLFDPNVFSCNEQQFTNHLKVIMSRFRLINIQELVDLVESASIPVEPLAMITFDDGYVDNFTKSLPILKSFGATATFFLPTNYIENRQIPWWEEVAWIVRNTKRKTISLSSLEKPLRIDSLKADDSIRQVLRYFKDDKELTIDEKMMNLKKDCEQEFDFKDDISLFMSWDQVRQLQTEGMDIGSHTCSHRILSHQGQVDQKSELCDSKKMIEEQIGSKIYAFAYPVGGADSYSSDTCRSVKESGYKVAFTFPLGGGKTINPALKPFEIPRLSLEADYSLADIQYATVFARRL